MQATFLEESFEGLDRAEAGLLTLDTAVTDEVVGELFRAIHSIKGGAGAFGIDEITGLAHTMESVLDDVRSGAAPTPAMTAALLRGVDELRLALEERRAGRVASGAAHAGVCAALTAARGAAPRGVAPAPPVPVAPAVNAAPWRVEFAPLPHLMRNGNDPLRLLRELASLGGTVIAVDTSRLPRFEDLDPTECHLAWTLEVPGAVERAAIDEVFAWVDGDCTLAITRAAPVAADAPALAAIAADAPMATSERAGAPASREASAIGSIRVGVDKIDQLMNMIGELVITQSMLGELDGEGPVDAERLARLREGLSQLARNTRAMQESVVRLRSMPVGVVFGRIPRLVHDVGARLGKEVALELSGGTTELDKTVLEKLGDPLVHIVRNSIDHGIELPDARAAAGKPRHGTIRLHAEHRGSEIVIEVADDGRGLDLPRIRAKAVERGLIGADTALTDDETAKLIFAPGFSTAEVVSDVSGRGVGMDVVWRHIKELGGQVDVQSSPGAGTRTILRLPLTLAIIDGQLIRVLEHQYVVPLLSIVESVQIDPRRRARLAGGHDIYRVREQIVPIVDLGAALGLRPPGVATSSLLMIVETDGAPLGLIVDELLAQQQVVIKSLESNYQRVDGLAGATILGDGRVAFILDIVDLARHARRGRVGHADHEQAA
ncbi:MAG: chemotaxis protein CheA [Deltaproteobacteria bacterium]|nr:chemotaxis protein CheA [Deltaproteobacteria bacterium]